MNNLKRSKKANGITLIALIITIVVLLILAVVTIKAVSDGGIIQKAKASTLEHKIAKEKEDIRLALGEWKIQSNIPGYDGSFEGVINKLLTGKGSATSNEDGSLTIIMESGRKYTVTKAGTITLQEATSGGEVATPPSEGNEPEISVPLDAGLYAPDGTYTSWDNLIKDYTVTMTNDETLEYFNGVNMMTGEPSVFGELVIDSRVTSINERAFAGCAGLTTVTIPSNVTSIGESAFISCSGLEEIIVDESNANYSSDNGVLYNKDKTILIQFPGGKTGAFTIPNGVTSIGQDAFYYCQNLTSLTMSNTVESIGDFAFHFCKSLNQIKVEENNPNYCSDNGVLYNKDKTAILRCPEGKTGSFTIPGSVKNIGNFAFGSCAGLTEINIPNSVTSINEYGFSQCTGLTAITIPNSVTSIGYRAFQGCTGLTSVTIPDSVTSIGEYGFSACTSLTVTILGMNVEIGSSAFHSVPIVYYAGYKDTDDYSSWNATQVSPIQ